MKLNEKDKELFKVLSKSQMGKDLAEFLDRVCDHICDSRTWGQNDSKESSIQAASVIRQEIRSRLISKEAGKNGNTSFE